MHETHFRRLLGALSLSCALAGCLLDSGGDNDGADTDGAREGRAIFGDRGSAGLADTGTGGAMVEPATEAYEEALVGAIANTVEWGGLLVTTSGARVIGGHDEVIGEDAGGDTWQLDPALRYAVVDFALENLGDDALDYQWRDTWDLVLADGTRLPPQDYLDVLVLPGERASTKLHYALPESAVITGALVQLEGADRGALEPSRIPLDTPVERQFPRRLHDLIGQVVENDYERIEIDEAVWDDNNALLGRVKRGKRALWLRLTVTARDEDDHRWSGGESRLSVKGRGAAPIEWNHERIGFDGTFHDLMVFEVDDDVGVAELRLALHDGQSDPDHYGRLPVDFNHSTLLPLARR